MSEHLRDKATEAAAFDRERLWRLQRLAKEKLGELAEEAADSLRDQNEGAEDFKSIWDAICYCVAKDKSNDLKKHEGHMRAMCQQALGDCDGFTTQVLAGITTDNDEFYKTVLRNNYLGFESLDEWTSNAIYMRLLDIARDEAKSGFLSYESELLMEVIACLRSLVPMAESGSHVIALGRAIEAVETLDRGKRAEVSGSIGCGFRAGDEEFEEGEYAFIEIHGESIGLSILKTTFERRVGSDHSSEKIPFPGGFEGWREVFERIRDNERAELSVDLLY
jgi:hypothetical protein